MALAVGGHFLERDNSWAQIVCLVAGLVAVGAVQWARSSGETESSPTIASALGLRPIRKLPLVGISLVAFLILGPAFMAYAGRHFPNSLVIVYSYILIGIATLIYWGWFVFVRK